MFNVTLTQKEADLLAVILTKINNAQAPKIDKRTLKKQRLQQEQEQARAEAIVLMTRHLKRR